MNRRDALRALAGLPMIAALPAPTVTYQLRKNGVAISAPITVNAISLSQVRAQIALDDYFSAQLAAVMEREFVKR